MPEANVVVTRRDAEAAARTPGLYVVQAGTEAYFPMMALVEAGVAEHLGDTYPASGHIATIHVVNGSGAARENPPPRIHIVEIGDEYFDRVFVDYYDWATRWWREVMQNSVDAEATRVTLSIEQNEDKTWTAICDDDGFGMDEDVLLNKFLMLGRTTKTTAAGTAGGFGEAKKLILFPWIKWMVHSQSTRVDGVGRRGEVTTTPERKGTRIEVLMPADKATTESAALSYLQKCNLPSIDITLNGKQQRPSLVGGKIVANVPGKLDIYFIPFKGGETQSDIYVRTKGLYMFSRYMSDQVPGYLIAEIVGPSIELLFPNRDSFRDYDARRALDDLAGKIARDATDALRAAKGVIKKKYKGIGKFETRTIAARILSRIGPYRSGVPGKADVDAVAKELDEYARQQERERLMSSASSSGARAMLDREFAGPEQLENALKQLVWEPDFYLFNDIEDFKVPKKFFPETMTPTILKLAKVWAELVRFVLIQLGSESKFGIGFVFSEEMAAAAYSEEGGEGREEWIMLNPFKDIDKRTETWRTTDADLKWLYAAAIHEATHVVDRLPDHDRYFATAMTTNMAKCADGFRKIKQIATSIRMKGAPQLTPKAPFDPSPVARIEDLSMAERQILRMAFDAGSEGAHVASPEDKTTVRQLEQWELVTVRQPGTTTAYHQDWYVTTTARGEKMVKLGRFGTT